MFTKIRPAWAEIDLDNIEYNMKQIREKTKAKEIIAVVKANSYGHGAINIAPILLKNGATRLAVAILDEALELRKSGINCPILILGFTPPTFAGDIVKYNIEQTIFTYDLAKEISKEAEAQNKIAKVHIALDTGMGRIGFKPCEESLNEIYKISQLPNLQIEGIFSHFSTADEKDKAYSVRQLEYFNDFYEKLVKKGIKINIRHIANSAAIIDLENTHFEAVRAGIILYGYYPSNEVNKDYIDLKPVMTLKANVVHVKRIKSGEYISYGRKFQTERESVIATLPIGYADGYTRLLNGKAKVIVNGHLAPVVGSICMDQCMIDVTDIPDVKVGDEVILIGQSGNVKVTADELADMLGTINYEITCMLSERVPRVYVKNGK